MEDAACTGGRVLDRGLLWQRGAYLSEKESAELLRTAHY